MTIEKVFDCIQQIVKGIEDVYQCFLEKFYDNSGYRAFWEDMLQGEDNQIDLLNRCISIMPSLPHPSYEIVGKDFNYNEILSTIEQYKKEIKDGLDINRALKIRPWRTGPPTAKSRCGARPRPRTTCTALLSEMHLE